MIVGSHIINQITKSIIDIISNESHHLMQFSDYLFFEIAYMVVRSSMMFFNMM